MARASSYDSVVQVAGVAMPARDSRKLVIDLSTQRSIARASFQTGTPSSRNACSTPSRNVTASKVPPDMVRTTTASGSVLLKPSMCSPVAFCVTNLHFDRRTGTVSILRSLSAAISSRVCQSTRSTTSPTTGRAPNRSRAKRSGKGGIEQAQIDFAGVKAFAGFERCNCDFRWTEQHRIDGVKVPFGFLENLRERPALIARSLAGKLAGQRTRLAGRPCHIELDLAGKNDGIVGTAHRRNEVGMRRAQRRRSDAIGNAFKREPQFVSFMQRNFEHAGNDLGAADQTLGRREDDRQILRLDAAILCNFGNDLWRRRPAAFDHQGGARGTVGIVQSLEQRLVPRQRTRRSGTQRKKWLVAAVIRQAPAGILACEARDHRIGGAHDQRPRPAWCR